MFEAKIIYKNGRLHTVEANTIEMLKSKCQPFIENENVFEIYVVKVEHVGYLKSEVIEELI